MVRTWYVYVGLTLRVVAIWVLFTLGLWNTDLANAADEGNDLNVVSYLQILFGDSTCDEKGSVWLESSILSCYSPAATRPIVSRAEERPPPLEALTPYFSR